ncbi:biotin--[acetyl-CoA-carboxylase] ligase [Flavobacterium sp. UMI-01]|uniref:biotin--[acetyl-CoA-carboxylase] ligase n=1 Tax=Flavobacterium sp. UMI-01 TaxID=1441053 RepID=UPI001C7D05D4|nr:biotin--[acetyl-CoA-carboxylase] ligase [Flavobacterium sp. UMI-01]GIZ07508.1 biotin--[acetyl-CoA-carboxylase] ligase [Flavobacterium sp. UMI-01]
MKLIKLSAIDSTNDFLKQLSLKEAVENFTVVTAESQTKGRGQMGTIWQTESGKNLIMSVFLKEKLTGVSDIFNLNVAVAVSIVQALDHFQIPQLKIKWPNDIMSYQFKIGGILIENSVKQDGTIHSIIGIGLNVNQINFENLPKASSLAVLCQREFDIKALVLRIIENLQQNLDGKTPMWDAIWLTYADLLFKKNTPMAFKNMKTNQNFMGIIRGVSYQGKLQVLLENDEIVEFGIKEVQMLY